MGLSNARILVPTFVLLLQIILKFVVNRRIDKKNTVELINELPTNAIFLAISFSLVYIFLQESIEPKSVYTFAFFVLAALFVVSIFRECKFLIDSTGISAKIIVMICLLFINFIIALGCLYYATGQLMNEKTTLKQEERIETKESNICK